MLALLEEVHRIACTRTTIVNVMITKRSFSIQRAKYAVDRMRKAADKLEKLIGEQERGE